MFVIIGNKSSKTSTIRKILKLPISNNSTKDIKCYRYKDNIIVDTPCISNYTNYVSLIEKCEKFSNQKILSVILFFTDNNIREIITLKEFLLLKSIPLYVYLNKQTNWQYSNTNIKIIYYKDLQKMLLFQNSKSELKYNISFKYLLLGETNVGKSTFINYLMKDNLIRTEDQKYTTKESLWVQKKIENKIFNIYDTYGLEKHMKYKLFKLKRLILEAYRVILMMDVNNFINRFNRFIIRTLQNNNKNISVIITKIDLIENYNDKESIKQYFESIGIKPYFSSIYSDYGNEQNPEIVFQKNIKY